jgi:CheY-like chemotaxis protein
MRSPSNSSLQRRNSGDSLGSRKSLTSLQSTGASSQHSGKSAKSDVDRLIEAIQEPHILEERPQAAERTLSARSTRPRLEKRISYEYTGPEVSPQRERARSLGSSSSPVHESQRMMQTSPPGEQVLPYSGTSIKPIKMPGDGGVPIEPPQSKSGVIGEVKDNRAEQQAEALSPDHMFVLVAEDDPVNSKLLKKRLEKYGHEVHLTVNGEDCATAFGDRPGSYDVILMDMQASSLKVFQYNVFRCANGRHEDANR